MAKRYTKELNKLINRFHKKLDEAKDLRYEVEEYIEEHYGIDPRTEYEAFEDECTWCYGFDIGAIQKAIENLNEDD